MQVSQYPITQATETLYIGRYTFVYGGINSTYVGKVTPGSKMSFGLASTERTADVFEILVCDETS